MKKFDDINQIEYSELKQIFEDYLKNNPEMLNSLIENFYENFKSKYPDFVIDEDETVYPNEIADWAYDEIGPDAYNNNKDNAKPFYKMAGEFCESYWDLLWVLSDIIVKYKDHDSSFISESTNLSGWFIDPSDELDDDSIIGGNQLAEKEDYDDLGIQININDFNNLSELCNAIKDRMKKGDY